jgi:transcriptional regulator with XRE-family HTH domain
MTEIKGAARDLDAICLGLIIRRMRMQQGWKINQLAVNIGRHPTYVGVIERGGNLPSLKTFLDIATVFGVDPGELLREMLHNRAQFQRKPELM